ncbi:MAG: cysteine desulfurase [Firmicutes bacterium]|nr:cysteine desulfurase [Bacillota bacterium]
MIYADNAATTKMSETARQAMLPYLDGIYGNPSSIHRMGQQAKAALEDARTRIAGILHCQSREILFTSGGSESDNQAIRSAARLGAADGKRHIVTSAFEHHAVLHTMQKLEQEGFEVTFLPVPEDGVLALRQLEEAIREDTCLVSIMFANNEIGTVQPVREIGRICREHGVLFHTDAVQAAGHVPIDVKEMNIDLLSLSAHKFHGPKGAGVLYARRGVRLSNLIEGGAQERNLRAGTENLAAICGMAAALEEAAAKMEEDAAHTAALRDRIIEGLEKIPRGILNGDRRRRLPGIVNFCFEGIEGETLLLLLDERGICASSGSACTSGSLEASHVLLALGRSRSLAYGSLRLSLCALNTEEEAEQLIGAVTECVRRLREESPGWHDRMEGRIPFELKQG